MFCRQELVFGISLGLAALFMPLMPTCAAPSNIADDGLDMGIYTTKGEIELYTGIAFPASASNYYCHLIPSRKLTIIARFDMPSEDMVALAKRSPKIPMLHNTSINADLMLSSVFKPYQDQPWFASIVESEFLLSDSCHGSDSEQTWSTKLYASFIDDQTLRAYLIFHTNNKIPPSKEMLFFSGIDMPDSAVNYQLRKKRVGRYEKTLNTSVRFDLPKSEGLEFIEHIKSRFHFEEVHNFKWEDRFVTELFDISEDTTRINAASTRIFVAKPISSERFSASTAGVVFQDETLCFYFDFYEVIGLRNRIEEIGHLMGIHLSRNVRSIQFHQVWYGDGKLIRFDVPKMELRGILSQLESETTLSVLNEGDKLKDRITETHGVSWWNPEQMKDMTWCIKNNGTLFIAGGTIEGNEYATVFVKFYDVGF